VTAIRSRDEQQARREATDHIRKALDRSAHSLMNAIRFGEIVFDANQKIQGKISSENRLNQR
jgi:hypothetical protein